MTVAITAGAGSMMLAIGNPPVGESVKVASEERLVLSEALLAPLLRLIR